MDKTLRSILWILVGLVVLSSFSTGWFYIAKERLCDDYIKLENLFKASMDNLNNELLASNKEKEETKAKLKAIEGQLEILQSQNSDLESQYKSTLKEKDYLNRELASVKYGKAFLEKKLKNLESDMFVAGMLKEKVYLQVELNRLKDSLVPKDIEIERLKSENMDMSIKLSKAQEEKNAIEEKLKDSTQVAEILSRDLLQEKDKVSLDKQEFEKTRMENNILRAKVAEIENMPYEYNKLLAEKQDMDMRLSKLEGNIEYKNQELDKLKTALTVKEKSVQEIRAEAYHTQEEVDLPPIVLSAGSQKTAMLTTPSLERIGHDSSLKGRVLTVNTEHNFVVIDLGKQDGIDTGSVFAVYRGEIFLGSIEVIQTRERIAAADIKNVKEGFFIEVNDVVVKR